MSLSKWWKKYFCCGEPEKAYEVSETPKIKPSACCESPDLLVAQTIHPIDLFEKFVEEKKLQIVGWETNNSELFREYEEYQYGMSNVLKTFNMRSIVFHVCGFDYTDNTDKIDIIKVSIPYNLYVTHNLIYGTEHVENVGMSWKKSACLNCNTCNGWKMVVDKGAYVRNFKPYVGHFTFDTMCQLALDDAIGAMQLRKKEVVEYEIAELARKAEQEKINKFYADRQLMAKKICEV